jgi:LysM repeat protein
MKNLDGTSSFSQEDPMKTFIIALAAAVLIAAQLLTPASAASQLASETCGSTYTVQPKDSLSKIASYCGTTLASILALNPQIANPNLIYTGQIVYISGSASTTNTYSTTYTVQAGDTLSGIASLFGTTVWAMKQANPDLWYDSTIYAGMVLNIPAASTATSGYARVTLSATSAEVGDTLTVYVRGFPANSYIDYRVGEQGEDYSVVYDGTVASDGTDSATITIPSDADAGEYWIVKVMTTSQKEGVTVTSHTIYITN